MCTNLSGVLKRKGPEDREKQSEVAICKEKDLEKKTCRCLDLRPQVSRPVIKQICLPKSSVEAFHLYFNQ